MYINFNWYIGNKTNVFVEDILNFFFSKHFDTKTYTHKMLTKFLSI